MKRIIGSLFAILAIAMFVMACGDDNKNSCGDGEVKLAIVTNGVAGEEKCFKLCEEVSECPNAATQECKGAPKVCRDVVVTDPNNDPNNNPNNTPDLPTISDENKTLCEDYCELTYGCLYEWCGADNLIPGLIQSCLTGFADQAGDTGCIGELTGTSADAAEIEAAAEDIRASVYQSNGTTKVTCEDTSYLRCAYASATLSCGCEASSKLGAACEAPEDCESGSLLGACIAEKGENGQETGYTGGYCMSLPCDLDVPTAERIRGKANPNSIGCGAGNYCIYEPYTADSILGFCYAGCESSSDCREGYVCGAGGTIVEGSKETMAKTCVPAGCSADTDCGTGANQGRCNVDTKACEFPCTNDDFKAFCESGGGECTGDDDKTFCVLP